MEERDSGDDFRDENAPPRKAARGKAKVWTKVVTLESHDEFMEWLKKGKLSGADGLIVYSTYARIYQSLEKEHQILKKVAEYLHIICQNDMFIPLAYLSIFPVFQYVYCARS